MAKYKAEKTIIKGIKFDSKAEGEYYELLLKKEKQGKIRNIKLQPVFTLHDSYKLNGKTVKAITYKADFAYITEDDRAIVVDVKGMATEVANIKRKIFNKLYGEIYELQWVVKNKKYGNTDGWVGYDELKKCRAKAKKEKLTK